MVGMSRTILANGVDNSAMVKTGHYHSHNRPIEVKNGQYPTSRKEHIANREQIVYIALLDPGRRSVVGLPNPGHKEWEQ